MIEPNKAHNTTDFQLYAAEDTEWAAVAIVIVCFVVYASSLTLDRFGIQLSRTTLLDFFIWLLFVAL